MKQKKLDLQEKVTDEQTDQVLKDELKRFTEGKRSLTSLNCSQTILKSVAIKPNNNLVKEKILTMWKTLKMEIYPSLSVPNITAHNSFHSKNLRLPCSTRNSYTAVEKDSAIVFSEHKTINPKSF